MTVADAIAEELALWGGTDVFGLAGSSFLPLLSAVAAQDGLRYHGVRHEEAAALMASAQSKLTGAVGICVAHAGPGAAHLVNGLYDAHKDGVPVLAITGQVPTPQIGTDFKQASEQDLMFSGCAGYSRMVSSPDTALDLLEGALRYAVSAKDVAHLAVPSDLFYARYDGRPPRAAGSHLAPRADVDVEAIAEAAELLRAAKRPIFLLGRGARGCAGEVLELAERLRAAVIPTLFAKGCAREDHPLVQGVLGEAGTDRARAVAAEADLVLILGSTWWPVSFLPQHPTVIQVDVRPTVIGAGHPLRLGITGRVEDVVAELLRKVPDEGLMPPEAPAVGSDPGDADGSIHPEATMRSLRRHLGAGSVIAVDTGLTTLWYGRSFPAEDEVTLISGRWRTMGFALPAAIGAKLARPAATVVALAGDGGFMMTAGELLTAVAERLPIVVIVLQNGVLGEEMVKQQGQGFSEFGIDLTNPDFAKLAEACGAKGYRAKSVHELDEALDLALQADGPTLIDVGTATVAPPTLDTKVPVSELC